jgi:hypothetical protein
MRRGGGLWHRVDEGIHPMAAGSGERAAGLDSMSLYYPSFSADGRD